MLSSLVAVLFVAQLAEAAATAPTPTFVTFYAFSNTSLALRHRNTDVYAANRVTGEDSQYVFEVTPALDGTAGAVSLRSFDVPTFLCCTGNETLSMSEPSSPSKCVFKIVEGLEERLLVSLEQDGRYVSLTGRLSQGQSEVALLLPQENKLATWVMMDSANVRLTSTFNADLSLRPCEGSAYAARAPSIVTLASARYPSITMRHCWYHIYGTEGMEVDHIWEIVAPLDASAGSDAVSLRSFNYPDSYICYYPDDHVINLKISQPTNPERCTFRQVAGLSNPSLVSFEKDGMYVALTTKSSGDCGSWWPLPQADVNLVKAPADTRMATWSVAKAAVRSPEESLFDLVLTAPLAASKQPSISLRSAANPSQHLCTSEEGRLVFSSKPVASECTFSRTAVGAKGQIAFVHERTKTRISVGNELTGVCANTFASPDADAILSTQSSSRSTWTLSVVAKPPKPALYNPHFFSEEHTVSPLLYGVFFEEINFAGEGGLYAELLRNRDFEALGRGDLGSSGEVENSDYRPWSAKSVSGKVSFATDTTTHPYSSNPVTFRAQTSGVAKFTLTNPGYWGINCRKGMSYHGTFFAHATTHLTISITLESDSTEVATVETMKVGELGLWKKYEFTLTGITDATASKFVMTVETAGAGSVWFDSVSLFPGDAVAGLFRKDVFDTLNALKPAFVRFPGGNYLEGNTLETRWDWKKALGVWQSRPGHYNDAWGYWNNDGLGVYEYLILCELLDAAPQMSIFTGYFLTRYYVPMNESGPFIQDAVDALEYANGDLNTTYGSMRARDGHPASFNMKRIEVGNEETLMDEYREHYKAITDAVWAAWPDTQVVASGRWGPDMTGGPCTSGLRCDAWDDHYYRTPDDMAKMGDAYDSYPRSLPKVFVGEYAANVGGEQTLRAGLAEAVFMIGFERNADVVVQASFAPLFRHVSGTQWAYDLINFNSSALYVLPGYHVQKLFREKQGVKTYPGKFAGITTAVATDDKSGNRRLKMVNYDETSALVNVQIDGFSSSDFGGDMTVLTASSPDAANTLESPHTVTPYRTEFHTASTNFAFLMPAWSLVIIDF